MANIKSAKKRVLVSKRQHDAAIDRQEVTPENLLLKKIMWL